MWVILAINCESFVISETEWAKNDHFSHLLAGFSLQNYKVTDRPKLTDENNGTYLIEKLKRYLLALLRAFRCYSWKKILWVVQLFIKLAHEATTTKKNSVWRWRTCFTWETSEKAFRPWLCKIAQFQRSKWSLNFNCDILCDSRYLHKTFCVIAISVQGCSTFCATVSINNP